MVHCVQINLRFGPRSLLFRSQHQQCHEECDQNANDCAQCPRQILSRVVLLRLFIGVAAKTGSVAASSDRLFATSAATSASTRATTLRWLVLSAIVTTRARVTTRV